MKSKPYKKKTLIPEHGKKTTQCRYESPHDETGEWSQPARYVSYWELLGRMLLSYTLF